ncbi:MAG: dihydropteroate synthase [Bacteroidetes bacterium]|nr:dihydropteroate synthase [Bacteroidota bacterium]
MQISSDKNTIFSSNQTINCRGKLINFNKALVMGILNITDDSFFDGGKHITEAQWMAHTCKMLLDGADIIDIGAASTRPGAKLISADEEAEILLPVIRSIRKEYPDALISVDTYHSNVAKISADNGVDIINDISGGEFDKAMFSTIAQLKVPYILMHIKGAPENMQQNPIYENLIEEMMLYFAEKINTLRLLGVNDIILDPGFGFGKTVEHNYEILQKLDLFKFHELPILVGLSRKSMINKVLNTSPAEALNGTTVLNTIALLKGAKIVRVHDVKEAVEAVKLCETMNFI